MCDYISARTRLGNFRTFSFCGDRGKSGSVLGLLLALCSGVTPDGAQSATCGAGHLK